MEKLFKIMSKIYHDENDPQYDAVERYAKYVDDDVSCCSKTVETDYHIYLLRSQIFNDVEFSLNIVVRSRRELSNQNNGFEMTEKFMPMINRWIDKYVNLAKGKMGKSVVENEVKGVTDVARERDEIDIKIRMGAWWNEKVLNALCTAVHDYVMNGVLYEYLLLSLTSKDELTKSKEKQLELSLEEIKRLITAYKPDKLKKSYHPFP